METWGHCHLAWSCDIDRYLKVLDKAVVTLLLMWTKSEADGDLKGQDHPHQGQFL